MFMKNRSELREVIMTVLYQMNLMDEAKIDYNKEELIKEQLEVENSFVNDSINGIMDHRDEIIKLANTYLNDWTMDRLNKVDQAILALAIYELMYTDTPSVVAINEAIELSKIYSSDDSKRFINGILDHVAKEDLKNDI